MYGLQTHGSSKVEVVSNTIACKEKNKLVIPTSSDKTKLLDTYGYHDKSMVIKNVKGMSVDSGLKPDKSSDHKSGNNSDVLDLTKEPQAGQRVKLSECNSMMDGVKNVTNNKLRAKEKSGFDALHDKPAKKARICNFTKPCEGKISNSSKNLLVQGDNSMISAFACKDETKFDDKDLRLNRGVSVAKNDEILKDRPVGIHKSSKQAKKVVTCNNTNAKDVIIRGNHVEQTSGLVKDPVLKSTSKERVHENARKLYNNNTSKVTKIKNSETVQKVASRSIIVSCVATKPFSNMLIVG